MSEEQPPDLKQKIRDQEVANCLKKLKAGKTLNAREAQLMSEYADEKAHGRGPSDLRAMNLKHGASLLGCSVADLKRIRDAGCPGFPHGRPNIPVIRKWMEEHPNVGGSKEEQLKERKLLAQINRIERENEREDGEWIRNEKAVYLADVWGSQVRVEAMSLIAEAPTWQGLDAASLKDKARIFVTNMLARLNKFHAPKWKPSK